MWSSPLPAILLCACLGAQSRLPLVGHTARADNSPWPGAEVVLLSRTIPADERIGNADVVRTRSDDNGRFEARLLPGRFYTAWALEAAPDSYRISAAVEDVTAVAPLTLRAETEPRPHVTVVVHGIDAWRARGELTIQALSDTANLIVEACALDDGERVRVPPLPGVIGRLDILCGGLPLFEWPRDFSLLDDGEEYVHRPKRVLVRVVAEGDGKPIAAAEIATNTFVMRPRTHSLGRTDQQGFAIVELPIGGDSDFLWVPTRRILLVLRRFCRASLLPEYVGTQGRHSAARMAQASLREAQGGHLVAAVRAAMWKLSAAGAGARLCTGRLGAALQRADDPRCRRRPH